MINQATSKKTLNYLPALDAVRAFAIILVIISHWFGSLPILNRFPCGELGVILFFVLSGFLITRILLHEKSLIEDSRLTPETVFKKFFTKRFLRILPIYYALIIFLLAIGNINFFDSGIWHIGYLSNFYFTLVTSKWEESTSHFWSLAVEEQFYLIWPFLIIYIKRKHLFLFIAITIVIGPLFRMASGNNAGLYKYMTPGCFDALGLGALLALKYKYFSNVLEKHTFLFVLALTGTFLLLPVLPTIKNTILYNVIERVNLSLFSFIVILMACSAPLNKLFHKRAEPLLFIGKISYGLYLYHKIIPDFSTSNKALSALLKIALLTTVASISYFAIEKPLLKFKARI